jgi:hypothetical protein
MAETLESWITRQLKVVDEDGRATAQILLQAGDGGQVWDRWDKPLRSEEGGPGPHDLATLIDEVINGAAEEWPAKKSHQVMLTALDGNGAERGRWVKSVKGKSQTASGSMLASESVQHASAMQMHVETMKVLLGASNHQVALQQQTISELLSHTSTLSQLVGNTRIELAMKQEHRSEEMGQMQVEMWETLKKVTPEAMQLIAHIIQSKKGP